MSSEKLIDRARRIADMHQVHPLHTRAARYIELILEELRAGASDADAAARAASRRLAEETKAADDGPTTDRP